MSPYLKTPSTQYFLEEDLPENHIIPESISSIVADLHENGGKFSYIMLSNKTPRRIFIVEKDESSDPEFYDVYGSKFNAYKSGILENARNILWENENELSGRQIREILQDISSDAFEIQKDIDAPFYAKDPEYKRGGKKYDETLDGLAMALENMTENAVGARIKSANLEELENMLPFPATSSPCVDRRLDTDKYKVITCKDISKNWDAIIKNAPEAFYLGLMENYKKLLPGHSRNKQCRIFLYDNGYVEIIPGAEEQAAWEASIDACYKEFHISKWDDVVKRIRNNEGADCPSDPYKSYKEYNESGIPNLLNAMRALYEAQQH